MSRVPVRVGCRRYDILIGARHLGRLAGAMRRLKLGTHPILLTNPTVLKRHGRVVSAALRRGGWPVQRLTVPDTERSKSMGVLTRLLSRLADLDAPGRRLFLVLVGGGVVGDLGGLAAGLYKRGIPYIQVPTTLLAQVDSSIGGKTAVDLPHGKNLVGLFNQPRLVFIDLDFLRSLPDRQFRSGLAEVIKCAVIRDPALFSFLERTPFKALRHSARRLGWAIGRAVRVKAAIVEADEKETVGLRSVLNFGHTLGHAIEAATHYGGAYTHGEAVAVGMVAATEISRRTGMLSDAHADRIRTLIRSMGLPTSVRGVTFARLRRAMAYDKKWVLGRNRWILPTRIGHVVACRGVAEPAVRSAVLSVLEG